MSTGVGHRRSRIFVLFVDGDRFLADRPAVATLVAFGVRGPRVVRTIGVSLAAARVARVAVRAVAILVRLLLFLRLGLHGPQQLAKPLTQRQLLAFGEGVPRPPAPLVLFVLVDGLHFF